MRRTNRKSWLAALMMSCLCMLSGQSLAGKEKNPSVDPNDPTFRLFQLLDNSRGGKLSGFFVIADVYKDPTNPADELQHILRAEYDKDRAFGKLWIYVRSVGKIGPEQMKTYTPKEFYDFGISDLEKFVKTEPGPFGKTGDNFLRSDGERPLASAPVTDEVRKAYDLFVTQYLLPALEKK